MRKNFVDCVSMNVMMRDLAQWFRRARIIKGVECLFTVGEIWSCIQTKREKLKIKEVVQMTEGKYERKHLEGQP